MTLCYKSSSWKQEQMCEFLHVITINFHKKVHEHVQIPLLLPLYFQLFCIFPALLLYVYKYIYVHFCLFSLFFLIFHSVVLYTTNKKKQLNTVQMFLLFKFLSLFKKKVQQQHRQGLTSHLNSIVLDVCV